MTEPDDDPIIVRLAVMLFWLAWLGVLGTFWLWLWRVLG